MNHLRMPVHCVILSQELNLSAEGNKEAAGGGYVIKAGIGITTLIKEDRIGKDTGYGN